MLTLQDIPGVGSSLANRLSQTLGSEGAVIEALDRGDIASLTAVEGLSANRAIRLIKAVRGSDPDICRSGEGEVLHRRVLESISEGASNSASRERIQLLGPYPRTERGQIDANRIRVEEAMDFILKNPSKSEQWQSLTAGLTRIQRGNGRLDRVVVVPSQEVANSVEGLESRCRVIVRDAKETWKDYVVFNTVTWVGDGGPRDPPSGWIVLPSIIKLDQAVPEISIEWFHENRSSIESIVSISSFDWGAHSLSDSILTLVEPLNGLSDLIDALGSEGGDLTSLESVKDSLWTEIKTIEGAVNDAIIASTSDAHLSLDGEEVLSFYADTDGLNRRIQAAVATGIEQAVQDGRNRLDAYLDGTSIRIPHDWVDSDYPFIVHRRAIEDIESALDAAIITAKGDDLVRNSREASRLFEGCRLAILGLTEMEMWMAVARWAISHRCVMPEIVSDGSGFRLDEARHLLLDVEPTPITYGLGSVAADEDLDRLALLTGANSGGKTTLLETIAMCVLLTHAGLPIPATHGRVSLVDELHMLAKVSGTQSAGALERTLIRLADVFTSPSVKLVLADELEAITEPGAAARILSGLLDAAMSNPSSSVVLVTHIGDQIQSRSGGDLRIDGIEARGLDENLELIVDRTPKRGLLARSTPELIVRRLAARSEGPASDLFNRLAERFTD